MWVQERGYELVSEVQDYNDIRIMGAIEDRIMLSTSNLPQIDAVLITILVLPNTSETGSYAGVLSVKRCNILPEIVLGDNRGGDWPRAGLPAWRPTRGLARKSIAGIPRRAGTLETGTEEWLPPEPLEPLPWEPRGESWKPSCDMPAGTLDTDPLEVFGKP